MRAAEPAQLVPSQGKQLVGRLSPPGLRIGPPGINRGPRLATVELEAGQPAHVRHRPDRATHLGRDLPPRISCWASAMLRARFWSDSGTGPPHAGAPAERSAEPVTGCLR